jgi:hypothetical protein
MKSYNTVSEATADLNKQGYKAEFNLKPDYIENVDSKETFEPSEFEIENFWRFEGMTDPGDNMILYTVKAGGEKGTLIESYSGANTVSLNEDMRKRFDTKK